MTAHDFLVEVFNICPDEFALLLLCCVTSYIVCLLDGLISLIFAFPGFFKPRECFVLEENADGSFSLRVQKIKPAFHRAAKIFHAKKRG